MSTYALIVMTLPVLAVLGYLALPLISWCLEFAISIYISRTGSKGGRK